MSEHGQAPNGEQPKQPDIAKKAAKEFTTQLKETHPSTFFSIYKITQFLGVEIAKELVQQATEIYEGEGLWLASENRKRTLGGCFFFVVRQKIGTKAWLNLFPSWKNNPKKNKRPAQKPEEKPEESPLEQQTLEDLILQANKLTTGECMSAKITLVGKPAAIQKTQDFIAFTLESKTSTVSFPKGIPPITNKTSYFVIVAHKQWNKVQNQLSNPDDQLIIEGVSSIEPPFAGIVVRATSVTSKLLQQAKRENQKPEPSQKTNQPKT